MQTKKLYYDDAYMTHFVGNVQQCLTDKKGICISLEQTAFYPEGGGQPFDTGYFLWDEKQINVLSVHEKEGVIYHYVDAEIPLGTSVEGFIDFDRRFDLMQQHTGEHMLSGIINQEFGYNNVGFHLGDKEITVDFDGALSAEDIAFVLNKTNTLIWANQPVTASFPQDVSSLNYRSKKELSGQIRIVRAGQADVCACCGTHTKTTAEVGVVAITDYQQHKNGTRIFMLCGRRALDNLTVKNNNCFSISRMLSAPVDKVVQAVAGKMEECDRLKQELVIARNSIFEYWVKDIAADKLIYLEKEELSSADIQKLAQLLSEKADVAVVTSLQKGDNTKLCIISKTLDTNRFGSELCRLLGGKGGGKQGIFQGFLTCQAGINSAAEQVFASIEQK